MSWFKKDNHRFALRQTVYYRWGGYIKACGVVVEYRGDSMRIDIRESSLKSLVAGTSYWFEENDPTWSDD